MECADEWTTTKWFEAISRILTEPAAKLEDYRRTKENVPFVGSRIFLLDYRNFSDSGQMHQFRRIVRIAVWGSLPQKWEDCRGQRNQGKTHSRLDILLKLIYLEKKKREILDPTDTFLIKKDDETVYAVADVLRQFFRMLDSPLICRELQVEMLNIGWYFSVYLCYIRCFHLF